jgi:hypothetical protein
LERFIGIEKRFAGERKYPIGDEIGQFAGQRR